MADLKIPNLCGASVEFNSIQDKFESLITSAVDGLDSSASSLSSTIGTDITSLETELRTLVPKLPTLPNVNLQSQITSLSTLTPGTFAYTQLLTDITTKFGTELKAAGYTLDTLVTNALAKIQGGGDLCSVVPNFELPADGLTAAVEKAVESKQSTIDSAEEKISALVRNANFIADQEANDVKVKKMQVETSTDEDVVGGTITSTTPPTENTGAYKVTTEASKFTYDGSEIEVTTPITQDGKNISTKGLAKRKSKITEHFKLADVSGSLTDEPILELKHYPIPSSVRVLANFVRVGGITKESLGGEWEIIKDFEHQNFLRIQSKFTSYGRRRKTSRATFDYSRSSGDPLVVIDPAGSVFKPHTKDLESYFDGSEYEGIIFKVTYSYFETYDPGVVEV